MTDLLTSTAPISQQQPESPARSQVPDSADAVTRVERHLAELQSLLMQLESENASRGNESLLAGIKVSVVIPVYNEQPTVLQVISRVHQLPFDKEVIVVDDCSTDGTRTSLEALRGAAALRLIFQERNAGKGAALRAGFAAATGDIIVVQDADLEYDPCDLERVIRPIAIGQADVVFGSRYLAGAGEDRSLLHRLINGGLTAASNLFTGLRLTDMETCHKAFRAEVIRELPLRQNRFGFEPEVTAKLARRGHRIVETPIGYRPRGYAEGKKIGLRDAFNTIYCIARYGLAD